MFPRSITVLAASAAVVFGGCGAPAPQSTAPADLEVWFAFGLQRDQSGLGQAASRTSGFLSATQIGADYGASSANQESAVRVLGRAGFDLAEQATNGVLTGTFSVAEAGKFFGVPLNVVQSGDVQLVQPAGELTVPQKLQAGVTDVFGGYATVPSTAPAASPGSPGDCPTEGGGELATAKKRYGIDELRKDGLAGAQVSVALLEVDTYVPESVSQFSSCTGQQMPEVQVSSANAAAGQLLTSSSESTLDVVSLGLIAPAVDAQIVQYDANSSIVFPLAAVVAGQATDSPVDMVSISGGFCSAELTDQEVDMAEWLLMSLAASGVTTLVSAGDSGSSGCAPGDDAAAVMYPSESPNVVSVGGSEFDGDQSRVWKNEAAEFAGGGGVSTRFEMPGFQTSAGLSGDGRLTPDVAFLADPGQVGPIPVCDAGDCSWQTVAGTSATAPGVAGGLALVLQAAREQQPDSRFGPVNELLYASPPAQDITIGDNDLYDVGCCKAETGYDTASGWGSLDFQKVLSKFVPQ